MRQTKHTIFLNILFLLALLPIISCASQTTTTKTMSSQPTATPQSTSHLNPTPWGHSYQDSKLGFHLQIPDGWTASSETGLRSPVHISALTLMQEKSTAHQLIVISVTQSQAMPNAFAQRGTPSAHVGSYPAFTADRTGIEGRVPCTVRIFLAHTDYVVAEWCSMDASTHVALFEHILSTYQPATADFTAHTAPAPAPQTCAQVQQARNYTQSAQWGWQLGKPTSTFPAIGWGRLSPGAYVCSNQQSPDPYLFQCTELANRFLYEQWALPHLPGNAARYYDYYQDGVYHPGVIHDFPAGSYQLSDDATQGKSAFRPAPGDLLIFQDVHNSTIGWKSGLSSEPGHVVVITGIDDTHVYVAQENYNETQYFLALPITKVANGYIITDLSGWSNRIVRGWIHFTVNGGPAV